MPRIIGIVGSPRIAGNTEIFLTQALEAVKEEGIEAEIVTLAEKEIRHCDACLTCRKTGRCRIQDDFPPIFEKMAKADGIILASPVYFGSATPQIKALIDRAGYTSSARGRLGKGRVFENKVGGAMVVARRAGHNFTLAQLLFFFLHQGMIIPGSTYWNVGFGKEKGEVSNDNEGKETARNFGKKLAYLVKKLR